MILLYSRLPKNPGLPGTEYCSDTDGRKGESFRLPWYKIRKVTFRYMVTCKSETPSRITDNVQIFDFELTDEQMKKLNALECGFKVTPSTLPDPADRRVYYVNMP